MIFWSVVLSCVHSDLLSSGHAVQMKATWVESISVLLVILKKQKQAKRSDTNLKQTYLQGCGLSESCLYMLTSLRETAKTPMSLPDPSRNQPLQLSSTESGFSSQPPTSLMLMQHKTHLVLTTAGSIHSPVQLWVAGRSHSAPQSTAYILGKKREISVFPQPDCLLFKHTLISPRHSKYRSRNGAFAVHRSDTQCIRDIMNLTSNKMRVGLVNTPS